MIVIFGFVFLAGRAAIVHIFLCVRFRVEARTRYFNFTTEVICELSAKGATNEEAIIDFAVKLTQMFNDAPGLLVLLAFPFHLYVAIAPFRPAKQADIPLQPRLLDHGFNVCCLNCWESNEARKSQASEQGD